MVVLSSRARLARELDCECVEIPCNFVKNRTGVERTGLEMDRR